MVMRLLSRIEINTQKSREREQEVQEGMKLAKRVDSLREIQAQEEASLTKFRIKTLAKIHEETKEKAARLQEITQEVQKLSLERIELQRPLDKAWKDVATKQNEIIAQEEELKKKEEDIENRDVELASQIHSVAIEARRLGSEKAHVAQVQKETKRSLSEAKDVLFEANNIKDRTIRAKERIENELTHREALAAVRERECMIREEQAQRIIEENLEEKRQLADQRATLERALKRLEKTP